ncbi:hypothetical protein ACFRH6_09310 [Streptomyces sp. NPDC056749]|uniref:hypothetical protein n=1 Tax=Streptomyces sp. NPDC056749 TaxID=3345936 RepID=UPI0036772C0B
MENHDVDHAGYLWDAGREGAYWCRWRGAGITLVLVPYCGARHPRADEVCTLFAEHPEGHSWEVRDPTIEALRAAFVREFPELFPDDV